MTTTYTPNHIFTNETMYTIFNDGIRCNIIWYKRTFKGSRVICRSLTTGRFVNHSIIKVAITYAISNKFQVELYN